MGEIEVVWVAEGCGGRDVEGRGRVALRRILGRRGPMGVRRMGIAENFGVRVVDRYCKVRVSRVHSWIQDLRIL